MHRRLTLTAITALALALALGAPPRAAATPHAQPPEGYYLALGDSLPFGLQWATFRAQEAAGTYDPAAFTTGYPNQFAQMLATIRPGIRLVNLSCPGESAASFLAGGCPFHDAHHPLHDDYPLTTSQLEAALAFLLAHPGQVSPITLSVGGNDLGELHFGRCQEDLACTRAQLPDTLAQIRANLDRILTALRAAAPTSEVLIVTLYQTYDPLFAGYDLGVEPLNAVLASLAAAHGARVADGFTPFTPATICALTFVCTLPPGDIHATEAGHQVLAQALWAALSPPPMPGLPNTGGGGASVPAPRPVGPLVTAGLLAALSGLALSTRHRRRRAR